MQLQSRLITVLMTQKQHIKPHRSRCVQCVALADNTSQPSLSLTTRCFAATAAALQLIALPAHAIWDGSSSAIGSCALGEEGTECRKKVLSKDSLEDYSDAKNNATKVSGKATGVPVAELDSKYVSETLKLAELTLKYATLSPEDIEGRVPLVKALKKDGQVWVSKYARGGSARALSARKFYIAVDAVQGHLASNGYAPFPRNKLDKLVADCELTKQLLEERK